MDLQRRELRDDLNRMRGSRDAILRARGDNVAFEENVSAARTAGFEAATARQSSLQAALAYYFDRSVQGEAKTHVPSTFSAENDLALLPPGVAGNQKIIRIECLDDWQRESWFSFTKLEAAVQPDRRDASVIEPNIRRLNAFAGARPAYAAFKSEVSTDLGLPDWFERLVARLGLGHFAVAREDVRYFALMEYLARDVIAGTSIERPFAKPTLLEARGNEYFFPAPRGEDFGFTADLAPETGRDAVREFLHARLSYTADHMVRVYRLAGPTASVRLSAVRDAHLRHVRARSGRADFGAFMADEVDE
ncbi:MAG: hypothetical protein NT133_03975 [Alphaproteobacteria bacterium]|nr:hypothetical protein [Alphaproteobacteria bacterium]